jgi:stearoyl-CoA desaturase (delta-9 desaturase)
MAILWFFLAHWFLSLFCQTFFLHRYSSHKMFTMSPFWEKTFYLMTFLTQGSSFLNPRAYAIMHRMHHAYSDTEKDPHSPQFFKDVWQMMWTTRIIYNNFVRGVTDPDSAFEGDYPVWTRLDWFGDRSAVRVAFALLYVSFYVAFAAHWWLFLLLPIHFLVGPVQGAIVNWCGHKYGYQNFDNDDHSKNSFPVEIFLMGELMQNNHHKLPNNPNFARKWFELDPTYWVMRALHRLGVITLRKR